MKQKLNPAAKPTPEEAKKLDSYFHLPGWQFEALIGNRCTEIEVKYIGWQENTRIEAEIFGLKAMHVSTKKDCIANIFVKYADRAYQCGNINSAIEIIGLIKKRVRIRGLSGEAVGGKEQKERKPETAAAKKEKDSSQKNQN